MFTRALSSLLILHFATLLANQTLAASSHAPFAVHYTASEERMTSSQCLKAYQDAYGQHPYKTIEVPFARLIYPNPKVDVVLCLPDMFGEKSGKKRLKKGQVKTKLSYFYSDYNESNAKCASLMGFILPSGKKPFMEATSGLQLSKLFTAKRVNCVFIVEDEFKKILGNFEPNFKYRVVPATELELSHWANEDVAKALDQ